MGLPFMTEHGDKFEETEVVGGFTSINAANDFDKVFESACDDLYSYSNQGIDLKNDINSFIKNDEAVSMFKESMLTGVDEASANSTDPFISGLYDQCSALYDNTIEVYKESASKVGTLLPIKALDLPLVIKGHIKTASNAIINSKVTRSPVIKKQIERTWIIDKETGKRYQYPQCLFTDDYKAIYNAGKGIPLKSDPQTLPLFNFDIIDELTDVVTPEREDITIDIHITKLLLDDDTEVVLKRPMRVNLADGNWVGGIIDTTVKKKGQEDQTVAVKDVLSGYVDFNTNTCSLASSSGQVKKVVFEGRLSNEKNERDVTFDYDREDMEWKVEDGFRADASYSLESLMDAKALLDMDLYKKTYNNLNDLIYHMEDNKTLEFLDEEFEKFDGVELDPLDFNPFVTHAAPFDCDQTTVTVALQSDYIASQLKFKIDRYLIAIADKAKLEDITFVIYGNPRYISLLDPNVNWVVRNGDHVGGVKLNYSYGVMTSGNVKVQVVSVSKLNAKKYNKLRFVAFPTNELTITFEHYKYSTNIVTAQNSAYRDPNLPGGAQTYLMGTSRYKNISIQGIQGDMAFENADFINC